MSFGGSGGGGGSIHASTDVALSNPVEGDLLAYDGTLAKWKNAAIAVGGNLAISDEGSSLTSTAASINFAGGGVTATTSGSAVTVTVPSASGSIDWINVKSSPYNATGNGSADDTTAVQAAITAAMSGTYKKAVFFPAGKYKMTAGILMQAGLTLLGEGLHEKEFEKRSVIINSTTDTFVWGGSGAADTSQRPKDIVFKGLCFDGSVSSTYFITPTATNASGAYPQDMNIIECGIHGYISILSGTFLRLKLNDCYLNNCSAATLNLGGSDSYIMRNFIDGYIAGSQSGAATVVVQMQSTLLAENYITNSPAMAIKVGSWSIGLRIVNNQLNGLADSSTHGNGNYSDGPGIAVTAGARGVIISGNAIGNTCNNPWGNYDAAISVVDASDITITGNSIDTLRNVAGKHIRVTQSSGTVTRVKVDGNTYTNGQNTDVAPIITVSGTVSNIDIDEWGSKVHTKAGAPTDADFVTAPPDGTLAVDTTNNRLYVRVGGSWKYSSLT